MTAAIRILVDETSDGLDIKLRDAGYHTESVKKMRAVDAKMAYDYNIIQHARDNSMILITKDRETGRACKANDIPCILVSDDLILHKIILPGLDALAQKA